MDTERRWLTLRTRARHESRRMRFEPARGVRQVRRLAQAEAAGSMHAPAIAHHARECRHRRARDSDAESDGTPRSAPRSGAPPPARWTGTGSCRELHGSPTNTAHAPGLPVARSGSGACRTGGSETTATPVAALRYGPVLGAARLGADSASGAHEGSDVHPARSVGAVQARYIIKAPPLMSRDAPVM